LLHTADLAQKSFVAEKENAVIITNTAFTVPQFPTSEEVQLRKQGIWNKLPIPRRYFVSKSVVECMVFKHRNSFYCILWIVDRVGIQT
jgi:hypothetical protein